MSKDVLSYLVVRPRNDPRFQLELLVRAGLFSALGQVEEGRDGILQQAARRETQARGTEAQLRRSVAPRFASGFATRD